jgi:hypothetical protein
VLLEGAWLKTTLDIDVTSDKIAKIAEMDNAANMDELVQIGKNAAAQQVKEEHFPATFDVRD